MSINQAPRLYATLPSIEGAHCRALINTSALRRNFRTLRERADGAACICVVKADAYGHGAPAIVRALYDEGCRFFAVSCLEEALAVREVAENADILVFGNVLPSQVALVTQNKITATLFSAEQAASLASKAERLGVTLKAHIKLDTGMNRLGFPVYGEDERRESLCEIETLFGKKGLAISGIYSHFATADEDDREATQRQAARFLVATQALENKGLALGIKHICNSAGLLRYPEYALDAVRLGLALYGYAPCACEGLTLEPVMRLETEIIHLHTLPPHERVGYGGAFEASEPRKIATIGIGYADGWLRAYTGARVTVHTKNGVFSAPVVGRICMDQCMLDVTDLPVSRGDRVVLFGNDKCELEALAAQANTIPYECLCLISARVPRE